MRSCKLNHVGLAALATFAVYSGFGVATAHAAPPSIRSFTAALSDFNRVTLAWQTQGGDSSNLLYIYGPSLKGTFPYDVGFQVQNGTASFRVPYGTLRYTLAIQNASGERMTRQLEINVPEPPPPDITSPTRVRVDMFNRSAQTISWNAVPNTFVTVTKPNGSSVNSASGSYQITSAELASLDYGRHQYQLATCRNVSDGAPFCSEASKVEVQIAGAQLAGAFRELIAPGQNRTLSWSGSGNFWHLSSPTLGINQFITVPTYTIPASFLTPGAHVITLVTCNYGPVTQCSNAHYIKAPAAGTVSEILVAVGSPVFAGSVVARIATPTGMVDVKALKFGVVSEISAQVGQSVASGAQLMTLGTDDVERKQLIVDQNVAWSNRLWSSDFRPASSRYVPTYTRRGTGAPLDIVASSSGDLFSIGEFSDALARVSGGTVTEYEVPLLRAFDQASGKFLKVSPFAIWSGRSSKTVLGERIIEAGGDIWFTQGGQEGDNGLPNHSRVVRFRPSAVDSPATEDDDRFCAYNVPGNNNAAIGIAWDGVRMWVAESRSGAAPRVLSFFKPSELSCENYLDYNDPTKVAQSAHQYCTTPSQTGCFRKIELPAFAGIAHLAIDSSANAIWFTEYYAGGLGKYDLATGGVTRFPLPVPLKFFLFESAPWQIRVDSRYVYVIEYSDNDLIRFDKLRPAAECTARTADGSNPCMSEIHLPVPTDLHSAHSIDLRGNRLWFTRHDVIGYVNTDTWTSGVIYTGLPALVDAARADVAPVAYAGISVHPVTGTVAVADFTRKQLLQLVPR